MSGTIRMASGADADAVAAIYAPYVRDTVISFEMEAPDATEMRRRIETTLQTHPWLVYETANGGLAGYAYASRHRDRAAYQWSVDVTVYLDPRFQRAGLGRGLYTSLFALLRLQGYFTACAGVTLPNAASVGLHRAMGFQPVGVYPRVGYKSGAWHDTAWFSLVLQPHAESPSAPTPAPALRPTPAWQAAVLAGTGSIRLA